MPRGRKKTKTDFGVKQSDGTKLIKLDIPYKYACRPYQVDFWEAMASGKKRAFLVWHRRAGKDKTCWNYLISQACRRVGTYWYLFPDSKMARRAIWEGMDHQGFQFREHIPPPLVERMNNTSMTIELKNKSQIQLLGSHDIDSLRGPNPVGVVFSEYTEHHPKAWETISPIFRANEGFAIFNGTPKGKNHAYDLYHMGSTKPDAWFCQTLGIKETRLFTGEQVDQFCLEDGMSEDMKLQEYYCSWDRGIDGSYYSKYLQRAREEERITRVPHDPNLQVHTAWDIGYGDSTAILFWQHSGQEIHIIDYYENHGEGLAHYAQVLQDRRYVYGKHYGPHDIESHQMATGLSAKSVGAGLGIAFVTLPTLRTRVEDGIEAARSLFHRLWFDGAKCDQLIRHLDNYHKEFDERNNCYKLKPHHDDSSHAADAFRYLSMAVKVFIEQSRSPIDDRQAERWYSQANPVFR